jgi:hypothetical protein
MLYLMKRDTVRAQDRLDAANLRRAGEVSALAARLHPLRFPTGLYKYRSVEEAGKARRDWELRGAPPRAPLTR